MSEGYLTDEINKEDIAFLLWGINSPVGDDFDGVENPLDADLLEFADVIYAQLEDVSRKRLSATDLPEYWLMESELMEKQADCFACCLAGRSVARECGTLSESEWWRAVDVLRFV